MIIGVTGTLTSGKSTVAKIIATSKNGKLFNADKITHQLLDDDTNVYQQVISFFGKQILDKRGKIDRSKLADIVFSDREKLKNLCNIIHPSVIDKIKTTTETLLKKDKNKAIIVDAPLLLEAGLGDFCDFVVVVSSSISNILSRAAKHNRLTEEEALKRIRAQMPISEKIKHADYVIYNDGTLKELKGKVKELMKVPRIRSACLPARQGQFTKRK